jgi:hypothetical protein
MMTPWKNAGATSGKISSTSLIESLCTCLSELFRSTKNMAIGYLIISNILKVSGDISSTSLILFLLTQNMKPFAGLPLSKSCEKVLPSYLLRTIVL